MRKAGHCVIGKQPRLVFELWHCNNRGSSLNCGIGSNALVGLVGWRRSEDRHRVDVVGVDVKPRTRHLDLVSISTQNERRACGDQATTQKSKADGTNLTVSSTRTGTKGWPLPVLLNLLHVDLCRMYTRRSLCGLVVPTCRNS